MTNGSTNCATCKAPDRAVIASSIDAHRASPDVDIKCHARNRQIELANSLHGRHAIYLENKFWIGLRDIQSADKMSIYGDLLAELRLAASAGLAFCPISDSCFMEVFKHSHPTTRRRTAQLIDELSLGVTIISFDLRIGTEIAHLLHSARTAEKVFPLDQLVWSRLSYVLGFYSPPVSMFDAQTARAVEKAFFDHMWTIPLVEIEGIVGDAMSGSDWDHHGRLARTLTQAIDAHAPDLKSFDQVYEHELVGVMDLYAGRAADILCDMVPLSLGPQPARNSGEYKKIEQQCLGLLVAAMKKSAAKPLCARCISRPACTLPCAGTRGRSSRQTTSSTTSMRQPPWATVMHSSLSGRFAAC